MGGPRGVLERQGRYTPVAALSEAGNRVLRRGVVDELGTAGELARGLAASLTGRATPAAPVRSVPVPSPGELPPPATHGAVTSNRSGPSTPQPSVPAPVASSLEGTGPASSSGGVGEPPISAAQSQGKARTSVPRLPLALLFIGIALAGIGLGGYGVYRFLNPARNKALALNSPAPQTPQPTFQPTPRPALPPATPENTVASSPTALPAPGAMMPSPTLAVTPEPAVAATPETESVEQALSDAQSAGKNGNWDKALAAYVDLAERYPNRPEPRQRLANLLAEGRKNGARINEENFATLRPVLERAARLGVVPAMLLLGQNLRLNEPDEALSWYEKAAQKGNS